MNERARVDATPLWRLHTMIGLYGGNERVPSYIIVSQRFLEYMRVYYIVSHFSVRGFPVIADIDVSGSMAYIFPMHRYDGGERPWHTT